MKKRKYVLYLLMFICIVLFIGCTAKVPTKPDKGVFLDNTYKNQYFGFELKVPEGWTVLDDESIQKELEEKIDRITKSKKGLKRQIEMGMKESTHLFIIRNYSLSDTTNTDINFECIVERASLDTNPKKYLLQNIRTVKELQKILYAKDSRDSFQVSDLSTVDLGGKKFETVEYITYNDNTIRWTKRHYITYIDKYFLSFIISYSSPEEEKAFFPILHSIRFYGR